MNCDGKSESLHVLARPRRVVAVPDLVVPAGSGPRRLRLLPQSRRVPPPVPLSGHAAAGTVRRHSSLSRPPSKRALSRATPCSVSGAVEKVSTASESISVSASFRRSRRDRSGRRRLKVLVNPPPRKMIDCEAIKERYLDTGVRGKVAVITGSSRGIGETAAKLFAMHGAKTVVHYYRGKRDAKPSWRRSGRAGGTALALGCDIRDEAAGGAFLRGCAGGLRPGGHPRQQRGEGVPSRRAS